MVRLSHNDDKRLEELLNGGAVGVLLTDTLYGIVARADNAESVERVYRVRNRDFDKPCIVLIGDINQIWEQPDSQQTTDIIEQNWPGPVSLILPVTSATPNHVSRGGDSIAFRLPDDDRLRNIIRQTGPLIAPSANPAGLEPASTVEEAIKYFGEKVDFYMDSGPATNKTPSQLLKIEADGHVTRLR